MRKKNIFILIVISLLFSFLMQWLINTENFLDDKWDLPSYSSHRFMQSVKLRHAQSQSNSSSYVENRTDYSSNYTSNSKRNSSAIYVILPGIGTGVEVII